MADKYYIIEMYFFSPLSSHYFNKMEIIIMVNKNQLKNKKLPPAAIQFLCSGESFSISVYNFSKYKKSLHINKY